MKASEIQKVQARIGTTPDGFWGPASTAACQKYLQGLMPKDSPWPKTDQASLTAFYGRPGCEEKLVDVELPFPVYLYGNKRQPRTVIRAHCKCARSLGRVFAHLLEYYPSEESRVAAGVTTFDGVYNNRAMRNGSTPSLHARGAAIDLNAGDNGNTQHWPSSAVMPLQVMEAFSLEGWVSAGAFWSRDAMHFQATQ